MAGAKHPLPEVDFVPGPGLTPAATLLAWLEGVTPRRRLRLPVEVRFDGEHRLGFGDCYLGFCPDRLRLRLDDTAMGISLLDQLRAAVPAGEPGCAVWLEGYWGALLPQVPAPGPKNWPFTVLAKRALIADRSQVLSVFAQAS